jgi:hypothetical protein
MLKSLETHVLMKKGAEMSLYGESELNSQLTQLLQLIDA